MDPTMIVAGLAGLFIAIGAAIKAYIERRARQQQLPQYAVSGEGNVSTQYVPQAPAQAYVPAPPVQQYRYSVPAPQPVAPYQSVYPWGYNAYIATIANTPTVQPQYTTYYPNDGYVPKFAPQTLFYNFDSRSNSLNQNTNVQGRAAPPGMFGQSFSPTLNQAVQSQYPWSSGSTQSQWNTGYGPLSAAAQQQCTYNFDIPLSGPPQPQSLAAATTRTYSDGTMSFCKIPSCFNDNGTYRF